MVTINGVKQHQTNENVKFSLHTILVMNIIICLHVPFLRVTVCTFMLSQIYTTIGSFFYLNQVFSCGTNKIYVLVEK